MDALVCYTAGLDFVTSSNQYFPCGNGNSSSGVQSCCYAGDYCMSDNICHYVHPVTNGSGYYMAGCTDRTWQDRRCPKQCTSEYGADVIYDTTNDRWNCCVSSEGVLDCQNPSDMTVQAAAPADLLIIKNLTESVPPMSTTAIGVIGSISASVATTSTASLSGDSSVTSSPTSTISTSTGGLVSSTSSSVPQYTSPATTQLSAGASAGIAIGCLLAAVAVAAVLALWFFRRRRRGAGGIEPFSDAPEVWHAGNNSRAIALKPQSTVTAVELPMSPQDQQTLWRILQEKPKVSEMFAGETAHEVEGTNSLHELSATNIPKPAGPDKT